jgi:hypothetical protein
MLTRDDVRRLALELPGAGEMDHHGFPSFRAAGKIFCTIHLDELRMMAKLAPEDQHNFAEGHPGVVEPVPGYWGRKGSTFIWFERADEALVRTLLSLAWANVAPKSLQRAHAP